jgi:hypothetical protein
VERLATSIHVRSGCDDGNFGLLDERARRRVRFLRSTPLELPDQRFVPSSVTQLFKRTSGKGKAPAHIEAAWNLSRSKYGGYLDCVSNSVENFERTAMALPGFVRKGTLSRIFLHTGFSLTHAETLANAVLALKAAEESAP